MDNLDRQILKSLQRDSRLSTEVLGSNIGLSATACQRRIKKLKKSGLISKEVAVLNSIKAGNFVTVIVEVTLKQGGSQSIDQFKAKMLNHPQVQQCFYVTGESDFVLVTNSENMLEYEKLTRQIFFADESVYKFHSTVVMENVKVGLELPV